MAVTLVPVHPARFWKPLPVNPQDSVAHLEARVLDRAREAVIGAGASRREQVPAGLEDAQGFGGPLGAPGLEGEHLSRCALWTLHDPIGLGAHAWTAREGSLAADGASLEGVALGSVTRTPAALPATRGGILLPTLAGLSTPIPSCGVHAVLRGERVPLLPHELQPIRRVGHDRVDRGVRQRPHDLDAVAVVQRHEVVAVVRGYAHGAPLQKVGRPGHAAAFRR